jgi:hypothetical protein
MNDVGRITPSWRTIYHRQIDQWRKRNRFYHSLREKTHQEAFNNLLRVWGRESAAMGNANIPSMMDILNLMANVHAKRCVEDLKQQAKDFELRVRVVEESGVK